MKYGVDVAKTRLDDLDKKLMAEIGQISDKANVSVLDIGGGECGLAKALIKFGVSVTVLDIGDYQSQFGDSSEYGNEIKFVQSDVRDWIVLNDESFSIIVMQRMLHYLPYNDAKKVLEKLSMIGNKMYLSVTGAATEIAKHYPFLDKPVAERFGLLGDSGSDLFSITAPVCLYTQSEIVELLEMTGWDIKWSRVSDFGNIKIIAEVKNK